MAQVAGDAAAEDPQVARLVLCARSGNQVAWAAIVKLYLPEVWKLSLHLLHGDAVAAEDLAQRTWERAQVGLATFRGEVPVLSWIRRICRNCYVDEWRRLKRVVHESLDEKSDDAELLRASKVDLGDQRAAALDLHRALAALDEEERDAFLLVKWAGYTSLEVADMLSVPASTVRSRVARAREKLAACLGDHQCPEC